MAGIGIIQIISEIFTFRGKTWALKKIIIAIHLATIVFLTTSLILFFGISFSVDEDTVVVALLSGILIQISIGILVLRYFLFTLKVRPYFGKSKYSIRCSAYTNAGWI